VNRIGMMTPNDGGNIDDLLDLGLSVYLVMMDTGLGQVREIRARYPDARILVRRPGGYTSNPDDVINDLVAWYPIYKAFGVTDWIPWNEADRAEEGGATPQQVADLGAAVAPLLRAACPGIRLHWPAAAHSPFYESIGTWKEAASLYDVLNGHWYRDADGIDTLGRFFESHFPGKEWIVTEYSSRGLNAPPPRLPVGQDAYEACRKAHLWPRCGGVIFFIWRWPGAEPGGEVEEIANDPETLAGLTRAVMDFHVLEPLPPDPDPPAPEPEPERSMDPIVKSMMLWQANNCRENTVEDWVRTLSLGGITVFKMKTHQARTWMARNYSHPLAPGSLADVARLYEAFKAHGIEFVPWCVPMMIDPEAEARFAIDVARTCGNLIEIDLEVGSDFIDVRYRPGIVPYFQILADAEITVDVDTACFEGWMDALSIEEIAGQVRRFTSQSYWRGFNRPYADVIRHDIETLRRAGAVEIGVVSDARAPRQEMFEAAKFAQSLGAVEWSCWAADMATPETYAGFALIPGHSGHEPEPVPVDNDYTYRQIMREGETMISLANSIVYNATPGSDGGPVDVSDSEAVAIIRAATDEIDRARLRIVDLCSQVRI
jgi:hypothetical protein